MRKVLKKTNIDTDTEMPEVDYLPEDMIPVKPGHLDRNLIHCDFTMSV